MLEDPVLTPAPCAARANEGMHVACAVDGAAYLAHGAAMLHSLLVQHPRDGVRIALLHSDDGASRPRAQLRDMVERMGAAITFHEIPARWVSGLPTKTVGNVATWYRIFLPELLGDASRVLYLDADVLVTDSLLALWTTPLGDHLVGAVTNVLPRRELARPAGLGLPGREWYFNCGVLLMNLALMRREETAEQLRSLGVRDADRLGYGDQDCLNVVLHRRRLPLHPRWNCMNAVVDFPWAVDYFGRDAVDEARHHPAIRHFEGPGLRKPWHPLCEPARRALYADHRRHTPWPVVRPGALWLLDVPRYMRRRLRARAAALRGA